MTDTATARERLTAALTEAGVTMACQHVPTTFNPNAKGDDWNHIEWSCTIQSKRGKFTTKYCQGIGHLPKNLRVGVGFGTRITNHLAGGIISALATGRTQKIAGNQWSAGKPLTPPDITDVVSSLLMDADAADYESYEQYAGEMGMDADSLKGQKIYEACRQVALDLNRVLGAALVEELRPLAGEL